jgi:hypothetical protein
MSKAIRQLLEKEVTRKEFLQFAGAALIAVLGLNNFIALLTHFGTSTTKSSSEPASHGFGASRFGR